MLALKFTTPDVCVAVPTTIPTPDAVPPAVLTLAVIVLPTTPNVTLPPLAKLMPGPVALVVPAEMDLIACAVPASTDAVTVFPLTPNVTPFESAKLTNGPVAPPPSAEIVLIAGLQFGGVGTVSIRYHKCPDRVSDRLPANA